MGKGTTTMKRTESKYQEGILQDHDMLERFAEHFTSVTTVVEQSTGTHYRFRKYLLMGKWGICNAEKNQKILDNKYITVEVLSYLQLLVGRNADVGWDVFSLKGNFLMSLPSMPLEEVAKQLAKSQLS